MYNDVPTTCFGRQRVWQELEYRIDVCRVTRGAHDCKKKPFFSFSVAVKNSIKVGPLVFLL